MYFSELNYSDKVRCLKNARLCIGESTGTLNPGLFAPDDCQILRLENPWTYTKRHLVLAHWTYLTGIADRTKIIYGQSNEMNHIDFKNSEDPLPQGTEYPINQIQKVIKDIAV